MKALTLDPNYWDCECEVRYIHNKKEEKCEKCGAIREEQPDSRLNEVMLLKFSKTKLIDMIMEMRSCGSCRHHYNINDPCQSCNNYSEWVY